MKNQIENRYCTYLGKYTVKGIPVYKYKVNPNTIGYGECYSIGEFGKAFEYVRKDAGIFNYDLLRVDFRFDNYEVPFAERWKVHCALLLLLSRKYALKNNGDTRELGNLLSGKSLFAKNSRFEVEYYHKKLQRPDCNIQSRLELRSKGNRNRSVRQILEDMIHRLSKIEIGYEDMCLAENEILLNEWK